MGQTGGDEDLSFLLDKSIPDVLYSALSDRQRRFALYYLLGHGTTSVSELADVVTGWTAATAGDVATRDDRDRVHAALHHRHLPVLTDAALVEYDRATGRVELAVLPDWVIRLVAWSYEHENRLLTT